MLSQHVQCTSWIRYWITKLKSRVARGNLTPRLSQNRTWDSRLIRLFMSLTNYQVCINYWFLPLLVDHKFILDMSAPLLHSHYRNFIATTSWSAPVLRIGTLILMGPPLGFLPYHRSDRFPRSTQEPDSRSRHLYAGRRPGSKQDSPGLIPEYQQPPVLTSSLSFRHLISGSLALASLNPTWPRHARPFP